MRPVNLTPPEDRRGDRAPLRAGSLSYFILGGLALVLAVVTAVILTGNQVKDREAELASVQAQEAAAKAQAEALKPYAEFASLTAARIATVSSLADSRFDWERVMRELALILPDDVWLTKLSGSAGAGSASAGSTDGGENISGPSLAMAGCAAGHESVARLLQALRDIDGVTRVGLASSQLAAEDSDAGPAEPATPSGDAGDATAGSAEGCQVRDFLAGFEVTVAFDGAPTASSATPTAPAPAAPAVPETEAAQSSVAQQTERAEDAANLVPGVAR